MPDLTAHDLYELVKGLPEEARPEGLWYWDSQGYWNNDGPERWTDVGVGWVPVTHAILLHEASVMRWLNAEAWLSPRGDGWELVGHCSSNDSEDFPILGAGPTRLHALVAAAEGVG